MKTRTWLFLSLSMGVFCGASLVSGQTNDAIERLGSGTISVEAKQKGPTLILHLESDLKDVASLSVSSPTEPVELLRISAEGHDTGTPAKASVLSSAPTVEGAFKAAIVHDLSQTRELVVTVRLLDGTSQDFHLRGSVVNDKVEIKLTSSHWHRVDAQLWRAKPLQHESHLLRGPSSMPGLPHLYDHLPTL